MSRFVVGCLCALIVAAFAGTAGAQSTGPAAPAAIPIPALQNQSREMIRKVFAKQYAKTTPGDKQALARLLIAQARDTKDDPTARYVALTEAMDLADGSGDAGTALAAIDALAQGFAIDPLDQRRQALAKANATANDASESEVVMHLALDTADQAAQVDAFDTVTQLAGIAESAANHTRAVRIVASIQVKLGNLRELAAEFTQVKTAFTSLDKNPADADAHLAIGTFYALHKGQWALGLPHLVAGSDAALRELATRELAKPADGFAQAALGDAWWDYAGKADGLTRTVVSAHATDIYKQAQQTIQGITLARIQSRIAAGGIAESQPAAGALPVARIATARGVDLLALVDTDKDAAEGKWARTPAGIGCDSGPYACLQIPYNVPDEYDLRATFTRTAGNGPVALLLVEGKHGFGFALDVKGEARFESVDKKAAKDNPTVVPVAVSTGRQYTLSVEVRKDRVRALLDDKLLVEYKTDYKDLSRYSSWRLGTNTLCGIGANNAKVLFQKLELVEVTGKGKPTRGP